MKYLRKIIFALIILSVFVFVKAEGAFSAQEVANKFSSTTLIEALSELGGSYNAIVDTENNKINIYSGEEKLLSFDYTSEYIEYSDLTTVITEDNCMNFAPIMSTQGIIDSLVELLGHDDATLDLEDASLSYETDGVLYQTESYTFSGEEEGSTWTKSGSYLRHFKITLDKDKLANLYSRFGEFYTEVTTSYADSTPTIEARDIKKDSVVLYPNIPDLIVEDESHTPVCEIYRSESENGTYEKISLFQVACNGTVGLTDEGLKSGTTYYYKSLIVGGSKFSNPITVKTLGGSEVPPQTTSQVENPKTGVSSPILMMIVLAITSVVGIFIVNKNNVIKNI